MGDCCREPSFGCLHHGLIDVCLLATIDGNDSCLEHVFSKVKGKGHAVVVVSEGAGEELLGAGGALDQAAQAAGIHQTLPPIGELNSNNVIQHPDQRGLYSRI